MSDLIKRSGRGVALRSKAAGIALVSTTLNSVHGPLAVASRCRSDIRGLLRPVNDNNLHRGYLPAAAHNHDRMLSRAVIVEKAHTALWSIAYPNMVATPVINIDIAITMLSALFRSVAVPKSVDPMALLEQCVAMFDPVSDLIGEATELWTPVSKHPVVLALAVRKLGNLSVFTSGAELRTAMQEARNTILYLVNDTARWRELLHNSDRCVFQHDLAAWNAAYARVHADVVAAMQDPDEEPWVNDDGDDQPASPRWLAQEEIRLAKLQE